MTRETKQSQKNLTVTSCRKIVTSLPFFQFTANLEQSRSRILDVKTYMLKLTFSSIATFYLTKIENRAKRSLTLLLLLWVKVLFWPKNADFLQKNAYISNIKEALVLTDVFSVTKYESVLTCQIRVCSITLTSFRQRMGEGGWGGWVILPIPLPQSKPLKSPSRLGLK